MAWRGPGQHSDPLCDQRRSRHVDAVDFGTQRLPALALAERHGGIQTPAAAVCRRIGVALFAEPGREERIPTAAGPGVGHLFKRSIIRPTACPGTAR